MSTDEQIESEIQAKGLTAPRVTPADIEAEITNQDHHVFYGVLTVVVLKLKNGFTVTGESACASPENFDKEIGIKIARQNAVAKIWPLLGFRLRDELAKPVLTEADAAADLAGTPRPSSPET